MRVMYYLPLYYGIKTRAKGIFHKMSFMTNILLPNLFLSIFYSNQEYNSIQQFLIGIMAFIAMYSVYEVGYLQNDTFTIRLEEKPTIRLDAIENKYIQENVLKIIAVKIITALFIPFLACRYFNTSIINSFLLCISLLGLFLAYSIFNSYRNINCLYSIFFILIFKYCSSPLLSIEIENVLPMLAVGILCIPVERTIIFAAIGKYTDKFKHAIDIDTFRVEYFFIITLVMVGMSFFDSKLVGGLIISLYFFAIHTMSLILIKRTAIGISVKERRKNK